MKSEAMHTPLDTRIPHGYARVTEILMPYCNYTNIPDETLEKAAIRGSLVHQYCAEYATLSHMHAQSLFAIEEIEEDCQSYVESFISWYDLQVEKILWVEERLTCHKTKISGQPDQVCILKGDSQPYLIDYKTSQYVNRSWPIQTAAYRYLLRECAGINIENRACVMLDKNGQPAQMIKYLPEENDRHERIFSGLVEAYWHFYSQDLDLIVQTF